jgi:NAD(P)-binding Rossmann-like domain/NADH:flavin oxidoreductase / NADH oxidase family
VTVPTIVTGRIMTIAHAEQIIEDGTADLVSMVRALIADPDIVEKTRRGDEDDVRPCIGTNEGCVASRRGNFGCVVNPEAGRERAWPVPVSVASTRRRVLIGGGGPAGMEAARVAAARGHHVTLLELTDRLGGQVRTASAAPYRADFGAHARWQEDQLRRLDVRVRLRTALEPDIVAATAPDVVVVATGSSPSQDRFTIVRPAQHLTNSQQRLLHTSWDVFGFGGTVPAAHTAVVYDDAGDFEAILVVEELLSRSVSVTWVTRHDTFGVALPEPASTVQAARDRLAGHPALRLVPNAIPVDVSADPRDGIALEIEWLGSGRTDRLIGDVVVITGCNAANDEVASAIDAVSDVELRVVGDALTPGRLRAAVTAGAAVARAL